MPSSTYGGFFTATAVAAGAFVGLLLKAISVSEQPALGSDASAINGGRASMALTALVTPRSISMAGII